MTVKIEFCGEDDEVAPGSTFTIGREADLVIDENPFLHRRFLLIRHQNSMWWIANVGSQLSATLSDVAGTLQAWLAPGATLPIVFKESTVWFTAGPTTYEFEIILTEAPFSAAEPESPRVGSTTYGRMSMTPEQWLLLVALAEPMLRRRVRGAVNAPTSAEAAALPLVGLYEVQPQTRQRLSEARSDGASRPSTAVPTGWHPTGRPGLSSTCSQPEWSTRRIWTCLKG